MSRLRNIHISGISAVWNSEEPQSILKVAENAFTMIQELSKVDSIFETFSYVPKSKPQTVFNLKELSNGDSVNKLAACILEDKQGDIRYHEKDKADLNYSRDFGFMLLFNFNVGNKITFSYTPNLGVKGRNSHMITYFQKGFDFEYQWFINVFQAMVKTSKPTPLYGQIGISNIDFMRTVLKELKMNWTIGIANYFSEELKWVIEKLDVDKKQFDDLSGDFIYCANPDFMTNKELYDKEIEKLISMNREIAHGKNVN